MAYTCKCGAGPFDQVQDWRKHYDANKPEWQRDRLVYAQIHDMQLAPRVAYVSPNNGTLEQSELDRLMQQINTLDSEITVREIRRDALQKRVDEIHRENAPRALRTVTVVDEIDNRPNRQGTRAGEMVIAGLRKANPACTYEMIYLEASMNGKVKIVQKLRD